MSANHPDAWYEGHAAGYDACEADLIEYLCETIDEWRQVKAYTHEELWASRELLALLELRRARQRNTE